MKSRPAMIAADAAASVPANSTQQSPSRTTIRSHLPNPIKYRYSVVRHVMLNGVKQLGSMTDSFAEDEMLRLRLQHDTVFAHRCHAKRYHPVPSVSSTSSTSSDNHAKIPGRKRSLTPCAGRGVFGRGVQTQNSARKISQALGNVSRMDRISTLANDTFSRRYPPLVKSIVITRMPFNV
jgi:hypothetical protein